MAGGGIPEQGGSSRGRKKKALDAVINVVPAIDLLSCAIAFLLFTAVWTQISRLQAQSQGSGLPQTAEQQKQLQVTLSLTEKGMQLTTSAGAAIDLPSLGRSPDGGPVYDVKSLADKLKQLKTEYPDQSAITVAVDDAVPYADLVRAIDTCVGAGLAGIAVSATG
jgi:biopolymer transport protein ExbD